MRARAGTASMLGAALAATMLALAPPAAAASAPPSASPSAGSGHPTGRIVQLTNVGGKLQVLFSAVGLGTDQSIDASSVRVSLDGAPVTTQAAPIGNQPPPAISRTAVIVIDVSGSMKGPAIASAKQAAKAFLAAVPPDVDVGLVRVSTLATLLAAPTTNRGQVSNDIDQLQATGNTALYDGTLLALNAVGSKGSRTIVLLTDGHDDGSKAGLAQVVAAAHSSGAVLDAVSFGTSATQVAPLQQITQAAGGRILATNQVGDFAPAFARAAQDIATQVLVTADVPAALAGTSATVTVSARAGGASISDSAFFPLAVAHPSTAAASPPASAYGPRPIAVSTAHIANHRVLDIGLLAVFVALLVGLGALAWSASVVDAPETRVRRRLSFYTLTGRGAGTEPQPTALGDSSVARQAVQLAGRLVVSRSLDVRLGRRLEAAGVPLKAAEWIVVQAASALGFALLFGLFSRGSPIAVVLGLVAGFGIPIGYLMLKEARRIRSFLDQLPETLQLIAGSLSVGHSLVQAMDAVVREGVQPMAVEFNRAMVETRLGMPVEDALEGIATRMGSQDFGWIVMAIRIQREVGGNLAEILTTVAATIRERERLRRQVRGLSAEGRLSAWILGALPPVFATYLVLVRPTYVRPLFTDPIGIALLVMGILAMVVGVFWLARVVKVEV